MSKLFSRDISPACKYCAYGRASAGGDEVLCEKRGVMLPDSSCKKFSYDPLKREPSRRGAPSGFTAEDFSL